MDPRVREVIEGAMAQCGSQLKSLEEVNDYKMGSLLDTCFNKNSSNPDRFASCFLEKQKKVEEILNPMQFKIMFFSKSSQICLNEHKKSVSECTQEVVKGIKEVVQNTKRSLQKI